MDLPEKQDHKQLNRPTEAETLVTSNLQGVQSAVWYT
jgi:hypothetical protein